MYAKDICFVDDTICTNYSDFPVVAMIAEDENGRNELLAFFLMESRAAFFFFLTENSQMRKHMLAAFAYLFATKMKFK